MNKLFQFTMNCSENSIRFPRHSTFEPFKSGNNIKRYSVKTSNFLNCIFWGITFSSLLPLVTASTSTIVDESYTSDEDVYDAVLNTFFRSFLSFCLMSRGDPGPSKTSYCQYWMTYYTMQSLG